MFDRSHSIETSVDCTFALANTGQQTNALIGLRPKFWLF